MTLHELDTAVYAHQWVALVGDHVAGVGQTGPEALRLARRNWPKQKQFTLRYVEPAGGEPLLIPPLLEQLLPFVEQLDQPIYVVGGAVRDMLNSRLPHDLDLMVGAGAITCGFRMGDFLGAPAYIMDKVRDVARIVLAEQETTIDIARQRGESLADDLRDRDLTINALALPVAARTSASVVDVVGGQADLANGLIRQASPSALLQDPVRGLRVVRMSLKLGFAIEAETAANTRLSLRLREATSPERIRDELFNLVRVDPAGALRILHELDGLDEIVPPLAPLVGVSQSAPHVRDVWGHTLWVLEWLGQVEAAVAGQPCSPPELGEWLAPWRDELQAHLARPVPGHIDGHLLWRWAAVLHDVGKPATKTVEESGRIRFFGHDKVGAEMTADFLRSLHLSSEAVNHVAQTVAGHMRPLLMTHEGHSPTRRTIYRFFKRTGKAGVDVALLSLADHLGTYGGVGDGAAWHRLGHIVTQLLRHYFEHYEETVRPVPLVSGRELMKQLQLPQGPDVGRLLAILEEAQAAGEIGTAEEALALARANLV